MVPVARAMMAMTRVIDASGRRGGVGGERRAIGLSLYRRDSELFLFVAGRRVIRVNNDADRSTVGKMRAMVDNGNRAGVDSLAVGKDDVSRVDIDRGNVGAVEGEEGASNAADVAAGAASHDGGATRGRGGCVIHSKGDC
jgi:hypothetical protein